MLRPDLDELRRLCRARDLMDREYARPLDVPALARVALMSTAHFSRRFREAYGETPYAHLMTRRIERAKALLRTGDVSVTDACFAVGCTSLGSFSSRFTEIVGETPSEYRARDHNDSFAVPGCAAMVLGRPRRDRRQSSGAESSLPQQTSAPDFRNRLPHQTSATEQRASEPSTIEQNRRSSRRSRALMSST